jgi:hypothetical protein
MLPYRQTRIAVNDSPRPLAPYPTKILIQKPAKFDTAVGNVLPYQDLRRQTWGAREWGLGGVAGLDNLGLRHGLSV